MGTSAARETNRLLRGVSTGHVETVRDAWRALLADKGASIPEVQSKLSSSAWLDNPPGPLPKYFGILLALMSEMDQDAFRQEITRLGNDKLHPVHRRTLDLMAKRLEDAPSTYLANNIPVFIADDVADPPRVIRNLQRWSSTKDLTLDNVTRVDVIAERRELDYLGQYNLFFSGIILTWPTTQPKGFELWLTNAEREFTFYHEVGHHVHKHIEGGQVAEQEKEADDYARSMFRNSRPFLTGIGRVVLWPFKPLLRNLLRHLNHRMARATNL
ncbi:hypothetical protein AB1A64_13390 [Ruegeria sp. ANG10]|uniref:hypothetical protein n=1 Tax=Ruegeria sp. ANG10 TaxID=3042467 RepID=UPI0034566312